MILRHGTFSMENFPPHITKSTGQVCPITRFIPENTTEFYKIRYGALQTTNWPRALRYFTTVSCLHDNWPRRTVEQRRVLGYWNTCRWHGEEISNSMTVRLSLKKKSSPHSAEVKKGWSYTPLFHMSFREMLNNAACELYLYGTFQSIMLALKAITWDTRTQKQISNIIPWKL
jgi:hypothetical protein